MDTLCTDLQGLVSNVETTTEYSLLYYKDVNIFEHCYDWYRDVIINKDWRWLLELINDGWSYSLHKLFILKYVCADKEILDFFEAGYRFDYFSISYSLDTSFGNDNIMYIKMIASIIKGDVDYYRENARLSMGYEYPTTRVLDQLYNALMFNQCKIIDEFFLIWNHVDESFLNAHFLTDNTINILRQTTTYNTIEYLWNVLVNKNKVSKYNIEFKRKLNSLSTRSLVRELLYNEATRSDVHFSLDF